MIDLLHLFTWYPLFGIPAGMGWLAVWVIAGHKRIDMQVGDRALLVVPWVALWLASIIWPGDKTLANLLEIVLLAAVVPAVFIFRVSRGRIANQERLAARLAWALGGFAVLLWLLIPPING